MTSSQAPVQPQWHRAPEAAAATGTGTETPQAVAGGEAWIVAHEPGAPVWMSASAPQIALTDQRLRAGRISR